VCETVQKYDREIEVFLLFVNKMDYRSDSKNSLVSCGVVGKEEI